MLGVRSIPDPLSAIDLRHWAAQCAEQARKLNCSEEDRERLRRMRDAILALADNADWLAGAPAKQ